MIILLFTIYDEKAEVYMPPFFVPTVGLATRAFTDCINSNDHQFGKHPADYTLFQIGTFDDADAAIINMEKKSLGNGVEYVDKSHIHSLEEFNHGATNPSIQPDKTS